MQVSVENVGKLARKLTVKIPAERYESQVSTRLQQMVRDTRLKGFRPGKVPVKVIEQRFGEQVRNELLSELIGQSFREAVQQEKLRPAMPPSIATSGQPTDGEIEFVATFEVLPELGTIDVANLAITRAVASVADADVDHMIETLRLQRRSWSQVERPAQPGDMALFEYSAQAGDFRHPESGVDRVGTIIGSGAVFKELEDQLVGHQAGDEIAMELAFPEDFRVPQLAGKQAALSVKLARLQEAALPELDDAFVAAFGVKNGGIEQFRQDVRANLERELKAALAGRLKLDAVEKLVNAYPDVDLPQGMVESEARSIASQAEAEARQAGQKNVAALAPEQFFDVARRRVAAGLLLSEIARAQDIRLDTRRVAETLGSIASTYEEPEQVVELYSSDPQLMSALQNRVLEDQVIDWIGDHAAVTEQTLSFNEIMRPINAA